MTLRRGFKAEAEMLALSVRYELGVEPSAPLDPFALATNLCIPIVRITGLEKDATTSNSPHGDQWSPNDIASISAFTVFSGTRRIIVHNDRHAPNRQRSNIAHELAHALLMHEPHDPFDCNKERRLIKPIEEEAAWLGPTLLVPKVAADWVRANQLSTSDAARHFGVSHTLLQFRLNVTGFRTRR